MLNLDVDIIFGAKLHIDDFDGVFRFDRSKPVVLDVETDEKDNFVGIALCQDDADVYYCTKLDPMVKSVLEEVAIVGHNVKGDARWLTSWGVDIDASQLLDDTMLISYVINSTKESHGLKQLSKELLGLEWTTYKEMVHPDPLKPSKKVTLNFQSVEKVGRYCASDCIATYRLWQHLRKVIDKTQFTVYQTIELPTMRVLYQMEIGGVNIDVEYLKQLEAEYTKRLEELKAKLPIENPNSNEQIADWIEAKGIKLPRSKKGNRLVNKNILMVILYRMPELQDLLEYNVLEKLKSTYTTGIQARLQGNQLHCSFNQVTKQDEGIITGRLSSSDPNLQNIPARTDEGKKIRQAFVPRLGFELVDADYGQIEPRLMAHFSKDPFLLDIYNNNRDFYAELVAGTGLSRQDGKTFMLALSYGAQAKKLASVFKCTEKEAQQKLNLLNRKLPTFLSWKSAMIYNARKDGGVKTLSGRFIPLPGLKDKNPYTRAHWERVAVNAIVQGSAAEIMKLAMVDLARNGYVPMISVHDELLFEIHETDVNKALFEIPEAMENIVKLNVPLVVEIGNGKNWAEAKG